MSTFARSAVPFRFAGPRAATGVARAIVAAMRGMWKNLGNRRAFYRLGEMTDPQLADIGLTRTDLHVAVAGPFGADPTSRLGAIASHRFRSIEDGARLVG